jgi:hypothetical protein
LHAVRSGQWKLHLPHSYRSLKAPGKDGKPGPYVEMKTPLALYDLKTDRAEKNDVAEKHPEVVKRLQKLAEAMRKDLDVR